jgi:DNA-directed RNA polymerase subunit RPC12/RpoP
MDVGENVVYSTPLKVNNGPQIEARGAWTATCTRCMAPAWQIDNPEYGRCPKCGCRMISAKPNMKVKPVNEIDFAEIGREPEIAGQAGLTSFEYTNLTKD